MTKKPRVAVVGDGAKNLIAPLSPLKPNWEFYKDFSLDSRVRNGDKTLGDMIDPSPNIMAISDVVEDDEYDVLILSDLMFDPLGEVTDLENFVGEYSQYLFILVLSFYAEYRDSLINRIKEATPNNEQLFYIVSMSDWSNDFLKAEKEFLTNREYDENVADTIENLRYAQKLDRLDNGEISDDEVESLETETNTSGAGKIISVTSAKGGCGKSTTALTLATAYTKFSQVAYEKGMINSPQKVILVDFDIYDSQIGFFIDKTNPNIMSIFGGNATRESIKEATVDSGLGFDVILGAKDPLNVMNLEDSFFENLLLELTHMYDYIIVDTTIRITDSFISNVLYPMSDSIVYITEALEPSVKSMERGLNYITGSSARGNLEISPEKIMVVVNKYMSDSSLNMNPRDIKDLAHGANIVSAISMNTSKIASVFNTREEKGMDFTVIDGLRIGVSHIIRNISPELPTVQEYDEYVRVTS